MLEYENFNDPAIYTKNNEPYDVSTLYVNFLRLLETYNNLFTKNIVTKNTGYQEFIYLQGMKCLNHIFIMLIHYTNNIQFTYYHCEKGIYYFTEFISQIENENSFLKLSSIDAIIFVYKKTIYNINNKLTSNIKKPNVDTVNSIIKLLIKINRVNNYTTLSKYYVKFLDKNENEKGDLQDLELKLEECSSLIEVEETLKRELR